MRARSSTSIESVGPCGPYPYKLIGALDDDNHPVNRAELDSFEVPYLGQIKPWLRSSPPMRYVLGIANPQVKMEMSRRFDERGHLAASLVHPHATLGTAVSISDGCVIFAGARLSVNISLGRHVHVNQNVTVGHDSILRDFVSVNPSAAISGNCEIMAEALIGAGSVLCCRARRLVRGQSSAPAHA